MPTIQSPNRAQKSKVRFTSCLLPLDPIGQVQMLELYLDVPEALEQAFTTPE